MGNIATSLDYVKGQYVPPLDDVMDGTQRLLGVQHSGKHCGKSWHPKLEEPFMRDLSSYSWCKSLHICHPVITSASWGWSSASETRREPWEY